MRTPTISGYAMLLLVSCLMGCMGWQGCAQSEATVEAKIPADFKMTFGQGGGFAGLWSGYVVHADGRVEQWKGPATREDTTDLGTLMLEEVATLWQQVQEADYFSQTLADAGNMTSFMEVRASGKTHRTSWATRIEETEPPASILEGLYDYSRALAQRAAEK